MKIRIDKNSKFSDIKTICCSFWDISNNNDYVITDENEGMVFDQEFNVNDFIRDYYHNGYFRIIDIKNLKKRYDLLTGQQQKMQYFNKVANVILFIYIIINLKE